MVFGGDTDGLRGDLGEDKLFGGPGDDTIYGLAGSDGLYGGPGQDTIIEGPGSDDPTFAEDDQLDLICIDPRSGASIDSDDPQDVVISTNSC